MANEYSVRMRIDEELYKKYKIVCVKNDIQIQKQTAELIRKFVEIHEDNERKMSR